MTILQFDIARLRAKFIFNNMATYDNLPVYKASCDLLVEIFKFTQNFSREYKFTLGER